MKRYWILAILIVFAVGPAGCRPLTRLFRPAPTGEVRQQSYPITVYYYELSAVVKAPPEQLTHDFLEDASRFRSAVPELGGMIPEFAPGKGLTEVGQVIDYTVVMRGLNIPGKVITLKWVPDRELWMMAISRGTWVMLQIRMEPRPEGSLVTTTFMLQLSKAIESLIGNRDFITSLVRQNDAFMTVVQSNYDPDLDPEEVMRGGQRGKLHEGLFQGFESSIWIDAPPRQVIERLFGNHQSLNGLMPMVELGEGCFIDPLNAEGPEPAIFCTAPCLIGSSKVNASIINYGAWVKQGFGKSYTHSVWIMPLDQLVRLEIGVEKQAGGTLLKTIYSIEPPDMSSPESAEVLISISSMPGRIGDVLLQIKDGIEKTDGARP